MNKTFQELRDMMANYHKKMREEGEAALKLSFKDVFDAYPEVQSIQWNQYTPYWNDGDATHFSVHDFMVTVLPVPTQEQMLDNYEPDEEESYAYDLVYSADTRTATLGKAIRELQQEIPDDVFETIFGDHCTITATREGFAIADCQHD